MPTYKVAVLDDYLDLAKPKFDKLGSQYEVSYFEDTLLAYPHPDTPQSAKDALVKRLEPFNVICM